MEDNQNKWSSTEQEFMNWHKNYVKMPMCMLQIRLCTGGKRTFLDKNYYG